MTLCEQAGDLVVRDPSEQPDFGTAFELRAQRPVAGIRERAFAEERERVGEADDVLPRIERTDAEVARRAVGRRRDGEAVEIDAARDDFGLPARLGQLRLELAPEVLGDADDRRCATNDEPRRRGDPGDRADVPHVASVRRHDERRPAGKRGDQAGGHEEVRVDDIGLRRAHRLAYERQVAGLASGTGVEHRALHVVAARDELALDLRDERPEIGRVGAGIHLRDEKDAHGGSVRARGYRARVDATPSVRSFGQVFDDVAEAYDEVRPGYPLELVDAAMERGALHAGSRVLEIGSGTGKLTELLARRGLAIDAVEPGRNMIEVARKRLGAQAAGVHFHVGKFEEVSLPQETFAGLFAATAFHWLDPEVAWRKAASLLVPGGLLALLTHAAVRDEHTSDEQEEEFRALVRKHAPELADELRPSLDLETVLTGAEARRDNASEVWDWLMRGTRGLATPDAAPLFRDVEVLPLVSTVEYTADEVHAHFRTTSLYFRIDPARRQALLDEDRRNIERRGGSLQFSHAVMLMTAFRS